jgi:hypothetical protein
VIELEHENLPGRVLRVRDDAAVHHGRSGWRPRSGDAEQSDGDADASTDETTGSEQA